MFYTYILQSVKNGGYYIGHCSEIIERLSYHNIGKVKATGNKDPWKVVYNETFKTKIEANRRELQIKKKKSSKYLEYLINKRK